MSNPTAPTPTATAPTPIACTLAIDPRPRLWPGVLILVFEWAALKVPGLVAPGTKLQMYGMMFGPMAGMAAFAMWWLFASRLRWADRLLVLAVFVGAGVAANLAFDQTFGLMVVFMYALPIITSAWVVWLLVMQRVRWPVRRLGLLVVLVVGWAYFTLLRFDGVTGSFDAELTFRWRPTPEQLFARSAHDHGEPAAGATGDGTESDETLELQLGDWPGFRGAERDSRLPGMRLATDWRANPPGLVWRHRVGPGWGSFAVIGTRLFTQEQRGGDEAVICYDADTGAERWVHCDPARFSEELAGPGPRATPTFHDGWLYTLGAAGRLNCLDPTSGRVRWSRDIVADSGAKVPQWGFASSPLVVANIVTVFAGNPADKSLLGYDAATGEPAWAAGTGQLSYCSPQVAQLGGVEQILLNSELGLTAFDPMTGAVLWQHDWPVKDMARIAQPAVVGDSDVLIGTFFDVGTRRLRVARSGDAWESQVLWTSRAIKPYYNDLVVHRDHLYGFDSNLLTCVGLADGKLKWKARGYGNGQVLLLPDQDLLLVLTDKGAVALVETNPDAHRELTRFQAIEGKTWNHPVIAHTKLFVRNGEEAACYDISASSAVTAE